MTDEYLEKIEEPGELVDATEFRSNFGKLQQQLPVRPDIAFAVNTLGTRNKTPGPNVKDDKALQQVVEFLYRTMEKGIFLPAGDKIGRGLITKLIGFSDAGGSLGTDCKNTHILRRSYWSRQTKTKPTKTYKEKFAVQEK